MLAFKKLSQLLLTRNAAAKPKSRNFRTCHLLLNPADPGSGAGKGGGAGGSIKEAGGGLGKLGAANEEGYFFNKQREMLERMKNKMKKEEKPNQALPGEE